MSLPIRTTLDDIQTVCSFLVTKPTGATISTVKAVLDKKYLDGRKLNAMKFWGLIEDTNDEKLKVASDGREIVKNNNKNQSQILRKIIQSISPYRSIIERLVHRNEETITTTDVAAHWHEHFQSEVSDNDKILKDQAVCFFQLAVGAKLGSLIIGRRGSFTRFDLNIKEATDFIGHDESDHTENLLNDKDGECDLDGDSVKDNNINDPLSQSPNNKLGQAIFIGHGKNKKPLDQLKKILDQFKIPYKVAVDEPNLGRPISAKVRGVMQDCNCAILIFTADEEFTRKNGDVIFRPSENVIFELGASGYLYENRIVIMKEESVDFPTNFRDLGYISFVKDELESKTVDILKELIGFGIVKITT